jgi:hypothetical protein
MTSSSWAQQLQKCANGLYYGPGATYVDHQNPAAFSAAGFHEQAGSQWFTERNCLHLATYLKTTLDNMDKAIAIYMQTYRNSVSQQLPYPSPPLFPTTTSSKCNSKRAITSSKHKRI